jgi:hypothetical protein
MNSLSRVYENGCIYIVAYDDGHGKVEVVDRTFTTRAKADEYVKENADGFINLRVLCVPISRSVELAINFDELSARVKLAKFWLDSANLQSVKKESIIAHTISALSGTVDQLKDERDCLATAAASVEKNLSAAIKEKNVADTDFDQLANDLVSAEVVGNNDFDRLWNFLSLRRTANIKVAKSQQDLDVLNKRVAAIDELLKILQ